MRRVLPLLAVLLLGFAPAPLPRVKGHATPRDCFLAYIAAEKRKDYKAYIACLTDDAIAVRNARLMYLAAFEILAKRDRETELRKVMAKHHVSEQQFLKSLESVPKADQFLHKKRKGGRDWDQYNSASKHISSVIKDQSGFAIDIMPVLFRNLPTEPDCEFKFTAKKQSTHMLR